MDFQIFVGMLLAVLPVFEIRGAMPVLVEYCLGNGVSVLPYFLIALLLNVLVIFFIFAFFDFVHGTFLKVRWYRVGFEKFLARIRKRVGRVGKGMDRWGYFGLFLFVAIPLPGSGAWTGTIVAWLFGLDRKKSFVAIAAGVVVAGLVVLLLSFGLLSWFY